MPKGSLSDRRGVIRKFSPYLDSGNGTVLPSFADLLAASNISVTTTFVSNEDKGSTCAPSKTTARKYVIESS